jgi:hypothetical protein
MPPADLRPVREDYPIQRELLERVAGLWPDERAKDDEPARGVERALELWRNGQW